MSSKLPADIFLKWRLDSKRKKDTFVASFAVRIERGRLFDAMGKPLLAKSESEPHPFFISPKGILHFEITNKMKLKNAFFESESTQKTSRGETITGKIPLSVFANGRRFILGQGTYLDVTPRKIRRSLALGGSASSAMRLPDAARALLENGEWAWGDAFEVLSQAPGVSEVMMLFTVAGACLPHNRIRFGLDNKDGLYLVGDVNEYGYHLMDNFLTDLEN